MKVFIHMMLALILLVAMACGGGSKTNKEDPARSLAKDVCTCIDEISIPKADSMAYKLAVSSCVVDGMAASRQVENVGMNELMEAIKTECPDGYAAYQQ